MKEQKITWKMIFEDFKTRYPKQAKTVIGFTPYDYATIKLIFPNQVRMTYNYDTKELVELK